MAINRDGELGRILNLMDFHSLLDNANICNNVMPLIRALVEWWWDITNIFHFRFREMTLTSTDFTMITIFCYPREVVEFSPELATKEDSIKTLLELSFLLEKCKRGVYFIHNGSLFEQSRCFIFSFPSRGHG